MNKITIRCFAGLGEQLGASVELAAEHPLTVAELRQQLSERYPDSRDMIARAMVAVNQEYATEATRLTSEDEIALIPLVSGG
jgi:molybdopterin converting factor subunit 1